nr:Structural maintenance of chromosomes protein 4 [Exophiala xenobiotica]
MVVDNVEIGQQCIECLRKNNLGRANFVLLDKLAQRDLSPIQTPENVPRLFDLIKPKDERFAPAFYSIMQNTLVAKDLDQANRIAYGARRWRVVTLDGQLIDVSGSMSGGGTRVARSATSSKPVSDMTRDQVQKLESERDQLERQFETFQTRQRELEASSQEKQEEIPRLETVIQKINLEVESCSRNLTDAQKRIQDLGAELAGTSADDSQIKALEKQITFMNKELEKLHSETASVEGEIQALQDKIMETKNEKLKVKNEKARADAEKELETLSKDLERLEDDIEKHKTGAAELRARTEQSQDEQATMKEELGTLKKDLDAQTSDLNSSRALEIEMKNKLEENQKVLADNNKKSRYWAEKLSKLALHDITDLEGVPERQEEQQQQQQQPPDGEVEMPHAPPETEADPDAMDVDEQENPEKQPEQTTDSQPARRELQTFTRDELSDMSKDRLVASIAALEERVSSASGIDLSVIAEYRRRCEEVTSRTSDLKSAVKTRDAAKPRLTDLRNLRLTQFMTGFTWKNSR